MSPNNPPPVTPPRLSRPYHTAYPTPPPTNHRVSQPHTLTPSSPTQPHRSSSSPQSAHSSRPTYSIPTQDPPSPSSFRLIPPQEGPGDPVLTDLQKEGDSNPQFEYTTVTANGYEIKLPKIIYDAEIPEGGTFEPYTYTLPYRSPPKDGEGVIMEQGHQLDVEDVLERMDLDEEQEAEQGEEDALQRLIRLADDIPPLRTIEAKRHLDPRPSTVLTDVWWISTGPLSALPTSAWTLARSATSNIGRCRQPLFLPAESEEPEDSGRAGVDTSAESPIQTLVKASKGLTKRTRAEGEDGEIVFVKAAPRSSTVSLV